jgi:hypothetical protein
LAGPSLVNELEYQMAKVRFFFSVSALMAAVALLPSIASAQSSIAGVARDASGGVMVGVSVQAASPALIEGSRTVTTNGEGRYAIVDVRPGDYVVTFTMQGFATVKQPVTIPANVTVTVDGSLKPGAVGETINVEAAVATVDVQDVGHPAVLSRTDMDAVPTARNMQSLGSLAAGAHLNTPDVGGSLQVQQTYLTAHGNQTNSDTYLLDGLLINTTQTDGTIQTYVDNEIIQESTYQTSNVTAEVEAGGVYVNLVPKDGGNQFHSDVFLGFTPSSFVGTNITQHEIAESLSGQSRVSQLQDLDGSIGGPLIKNRLWFLLVGRKQVANLQSAGSLFTNGKPGIEFDRIYTGTGRLTYQLTPKHKISAMWMRAWKFIDDDIVTGAASYNDVNPNISSNYRRPVMYYILQSRWTGTLTPKLIVQGGISLDKLDYTVLNQPGVFVGDTTAAGIAASAELDSVTLSRSISGGNNVYYKFDRYAYNLTGQYVTGSHQIKFGYMDSFGPSYANNVYNGDAVYNYKSGIPFNITAYDTPTYSKPYLDHDLGVYAMDTWNFKRLSVTAGIRWEYLSNHIDPENAPAGRFVPARSYAKVDCSTVKGMSCFSDWTPRLGFVYDLRGNHKTALKAGIGKYDVPIVTSNLNNFNPMFLASEAITWTGAPTTSCQVAPGSALSAMTAGNPGCFPLGGGFLQGNVGANPNPSFGVAPNISMDPNYHREYSWQFSAGIQQEIWRGVTFNWNWNRRLEYQEMYVQNGAVPASAWTPQTIFNPLDGTPITVFNLNQSSVGLTPVLHETNAPRSLANNIYNGFETSVSARLPHNISVYFGWSLDNEWDRSCAANANQQEINDPNSLRYCDMSGQSGLTSNGFNVQSLGALTGVPYRNEIKISGNVPLRWGFELSFNIFNAPVNSNFTYNTITNVTNTSYNAFTADVQGFAGLGWTLSPTSTYPKDCNCPNPGGIVDANLKQGTEFIPLIAPGTRLTPRYNQDDISFRRNFRIKEKYTITGEFSVFNLVNQSIPLTQSESLGTSAAIFMDSKQCSAANNPTNCGLGGAPSVISNPRMFRIAAQFKF